MNYSGRASELGGIEFTDDGPVYHALSVYLVELSRRSIDILKQNFHDKVQCKAPEGSALTFGDTRIFL